MSKLCSILGARIVGLLLVATPAHAASSSATKASAPPRVGACKSYDLKALGSPTESSRPVPCSRRHTAQVIAVGLLAKGTARADALEPKGANALRIEKRCYPALWRTLGTTASHRDITAYTFGWYVPNARQWAAGARWFRCDVVLPGEARMIALPTHRVPFLHGARITNKLRRCLDSNHVKISCASRHAYRSVGTFRVRGAYPGYARMYARARARCTRMVTTSGWWSTWRPGPAWRAGDHVVVCYAWGK